MPMLNADGEPVHLGFPFRRGTDGKVACDVQGSQGHVMTQVDMVLAYPLGYRAEAPAFGIPWPAFAPAPIDATAIQAAVERQVPDCDIHWTEASGGPGVRVIDIDVETP